MVGLSRRKERLDEMSKKFTDKKFYGIKTDIRDEEEILNAFKWVKENLGPISILVNCAGLIKNITLLNGSTSDFKNVLDTNVLGLTIATREAVQDMRANSIDGHVIHINSVDGHYVPHIPNMNIYAASKFAVTALTETLRQEFNTIKSKIKITVSVFIFSTLSIIDSCFLSQIVKNNLIKIIVYIIKVIMSVR